VTEEQLERGHEGPHRISAVVPVHNEERVLAAVIRSIEAQSHPPDELVLVFDGCTDRSEEVARAYSHRAVRVDFKNMAAACLAGIDASRWENVALFDGNTRIPSDCLATMTRVWTSIDPAVVEWHGGIMLLSKATLRRFGPFSRRHLWTLEYFLRVRASGGVVVHLDGAIERMKPSPLSRNVRYGLDYADLCVDYGLPGFFHIGSKSGWVPDIFAFMGTVAGHVRNRRLWTSIQRLPTHLQGR
jgi:glycosyltransferase involved in cell wall biosynthesis